MKRKQLRELLFITVVFLGVTTIFTHSLADGIDKSMDMRESMLCQSAKISGNTGYLGNCK